MTTQPPIFVVGASRSGTTLLRLILNAHPSIAMPDELSYFTLFKRVPTPWNTTLDPRLYGTLIDRFLAQNEPVLSGVDLGQLRIAMMEGPPTIRTPYAKALDAWAAAEGKPCWGEKTPHNVFYVPELYAMFPEARFVHMVRDPRAVVHSMNNFRRCSSNTVANAGNWRTFMERGAAVLERTVPASQRTTLHFEALTSTPEPVLLQLCNFLQIPFNPDMLAFHERAGDYMHPVYTKLGGAQTVTKPINTKTKARWQTEMASIDVATVEYMCGTWMNVYGYDRSGARLSPSDHARLMPERAYCQYKRWQHRHDRVHLIHYEMPWTSSSPHDNG